MADMAVKAESIQMTNMNLHLDNNYYVVLLWNKEHCTCLGV